ncbi:MAG: type I DNA topoisomerase [Vicingaceae bacterium]
MAKNLVIVESPAKAKTIEGFLGKDFTVKSSFGHIRDLPGKNISIDIENNFEPQYVITDDKKKVVAELKKIAKSAEMVWLATDEDREGEAISWHLLEALGLKEKDTKRIVFSEITKSAITAAIEKPRKVNKDLVDAQQARRVLDRLVGYELSPVLWKKVKPSLSAGRVQSVTVRLIVEREREINAFKVDDFYKVVGYFQVKSGKAFKAEVSSRFKEYDEAKKFLEECEKSTFSIKDLIKKPAKKSPAAPFTTSTLQQEASRKLGFSVAQTMMVAQKLYEAGKITYMRTDSVNLSDTAVNGAAAYIKDQYGSDFSNPKKYSTKSKGAQEAHEAIRPTNLGMDQLSGAGQENRLYELIWKRTIASQMSDAKIERTTATIDVSESNQDFTAKGEILQFEGFLKVYLEGNDDEDEESASKATPGNAAMLPNLKKGDNLEMNEITSTQRFTQHPPRYQEASLVRKLEELGIGRPSTYAPTISTIQKRGYVVKEEREGKERNYQILTLTKDGIKETKATERTGAEKNKLFPTDTGLVVTDFLTEHFKEIMDYSFTADVEKQFDDIADGQLQWNKMIEKFYNPFHASVENTLENADRAKGERLLGEDPKSGKPIYARIGRYGAMVQIGDVEDEEKPKFASLLKDQSIESITFEEALQLFEFPKTIGTYENEEIIVSQGRYGPYVKFGDMFVSIPRDEDMASVDLSRAIQLIKEKQQADAPIAEYENLPVQKGTGRFGPFIKWNGMFINVNKKYNFDNLSYDDIVELIEDKKQKEIDKYIHQWDEEGISVLKARWGRYNIVKGKTKIELPKTFKVEELTLEEAKKMIEEKASKKKTKPKSKAKKKKH